MGSIVDKITGKAKQAIGNVTGDPGTRRQGREEERKGKKKEELSDAQRNADRKAQEVANLERETA
jgi:uncharacterized protein YjbJ (UPF0337 family)